MCVRTNSLRALGELRNLRSLWSLTAMTSLRGSTQPVYKPADKDSSYDIFNSAKLVGSSEWVPDLTGWHHLLWPDRTPPWPGHGCMHLHLAGYFHLAVWEKRRLSALQEGLAQINRTHGSGQDEWLSNTELSQDFDFRLQTSTGFRGFTFSLGVTHATRVLNKSSPCSNTIGLIRVVVLICCQ